MLALADQALVELAGEQGDLGLTEVMAEGAAGEADLLAAAGGKQGRIQLGPAFWGLEEGRDHGRPGKWVHLYYQEGGSFVCLALGVFQEW